MTCDFVRSRLALFLYGELSFDEEERLEQHVAACAGCRRELEAEQSLHAVLEMRRVEPSPALLAQSRSRLWQRLDSPASSGRGVSGLSRWFPRLPAAFSSAWLRPVGALALIAAGFFGARLTSMNGVLPVANGQPNFAGARVRYLEPGDSGRVRIGLEETRQRVVSGTLDDLRIRELLLAAARDPNDPGLRVESVDLLKNQSATHDIRSALLHVLQNDPNDGVRLKALEGIRTFAADPEVRATLTQVLLNDDNPGVRTQAIDLLVAHSDRHLVGTLQELLLKEDNDYIRQRSQRALQSMKASWETF
ncbi:MAG: HEAT repeat domain-containing protein [Bryobacteraceae bacterium]